MQSDTSSGDPVMLVEAARMGLAAPLEGGVNGGGEMVIGMDTTTTTSGELEEKGMIRIGDEGDKINSIGGSRWPRQETLALLEIRSDMDAVFRHSCLKGPLWEEVSRKLGELGYKRSAKKCKEKFENVYKYHKRTKVTRNAKPEGKTKTYRFFHQLQALESRSFIQSHSPQPQPQPQPPNNLATNTLITLPFPPRPNDHLNFTTTTTTTASTVPSTANPSPFATGMATASTSSSTASDDDLEERYRKKRKWKEYFRRLTRSVLARQEEMQKRFLEAIDKREHERVAHQEAWRMQEMARINREHEILVQERSTVAAKDAAVIACLQKLSARNTPPPPPPTSPPPQPQLMIPNNCEKFEFQKVINYNNHHIHSSNGSGSGGGGSGGGGGGISLSSSRWPKAEVHALIRLRTSLDAKYQDNGPKGPLWEEISLGMQRLGYNRSAKRCKEKWENINKYFKKIRESNRQRREDSKTCPYYRELDALYSQKSQTQSNNSINNFNFNPFCSLGHNVEPLMVQPEQQWRPPKENAGHEDDDEEEEEHGASMDLEEEGGRRGNEIDNNNNNNNGTNKLSSVDTVE